MQQLSISKRDNYTIKIGLRRIQNLCHQPSFLGPDLPQELLMESTDSPGKQIVGAMVSQEDVWVSPGTSSTSLEAGLEPTILLVSVT